LSALASGPAARRSEFSGRTGVRRGGAHQHPYDDRRLRFVHRPPAGRMLPRSPSSGRSTDGPRRTPRGSPRPLHTERKPCRAKSPTGLWKLSTRPGANRRRPRWQSRSLPPKPLISHEKPPPEPPGATGGSPRLPMGSLSGMVGRLRNRDSMGATRRRSARDPGGRDSNPAFGEVELSVFR
jgi:hypothetical protein